MTAKIYLIRLNGTPKYVGCTTQGLNRRWSEHKYSSKTNTDKSSPLLCEAIRQHGAAAFTIEVVCEHPDKTYAIQVLEPKYILEFATHVDNGGYNKTNGGAGASGFSAIKGRPKSAEHRAKISAGLKGNKNCLGYKHSDEHREKMRQGMKQLWAKIKNQ